jgi:hypothetical protein
VLTDYFFSSWSRNSGTQEILEVAVLWDLTPCCRLAGCWYVRGTCFLCCQGRWVQLIPHLHNSSSETWVHLYQTVCCNIAEDGYLHSHGSKNLKHYTSNTTYCCWFCFVISIQNQKLVDNGVNIFLPLFFNSMNLCMSLMYDNLCSGSTHQCTIFAWSMIHGAESKIFLFLDITLFKQNTFISCKVPGVQQNLFCSFWVQDIRLALKRRLEW